MKTTISVGALLATALLISAAWAGGTTTQPTDDPHGGVAELDDADRLVHQLIEHSAKPSASKDRHSLYLLDVESGKATLIADEPVPGLTHCGSARWSRDGKRILFDATPDNDWNQTHLFAIDPGEHGPKTTDLGPGNCPDPSPDGKLIAFLVNPGAGLGERPGIYVMKPDGSERLPLGRFGRPYWSPSGRQILIVDFGDRYEAVGLSLMDVETRTLHQVRLPFLEFHSIPRWADDDTLVAVVGRGESLGIALVDVSDPERAKIKDVLLEEAHQPDLVPSDLIYTPVSRRCFFVDAKREEMALFSVLRGEPDTAVRLERGPADKFIADIALSPDGRRLIFCSDRPAPSSP